MGLTFAVVKFFFGRFALMLPYVHSEVPYGFIRDGSPDGYLDFHTAPELCF